MSTEATASGREPTRPLEALRETVRTDRLVQGTLAVLGCLTLHHGWIAVVQSTPATGASGHLDHTLGPFVVLLLTVVSLWRGLDRLQPEERRFWRDVSAGMSGWLAVAGIYLVVPSDQRSLAIQLLIEACFAAFYIALVLAVERQPHRADRWRPTDLERLLAWPAVVGLIIGLFGYFVVVPRLGQSQEHEIVGSTFLLYTTLDAYLAGRFLVLSRTARPIRWKTLYFLLGLAMALIFVNDLLEWQVLSGQLSGLAPLLDYIYYFPFVLMVLARCRHTPFRDRRADPESAERPELYFTRPSGRTMTHAVGFALLHLACYQVDFFPVVLKPAHESLTFWFVLGLGTVAVIQHRLLERKAQELWRTREKFELSMRHNEQDLRLMIERYHAEEQLRLSEQKFAKAFHVCPDGMAITSVAEGRFLEVNEGFERQSGYSRDELIGQNAPSFGLWGMPGERDAMFEILTNKGSVRNFEGAMRNRSGELRQVLFSAEQLTIDGERYLLSVTREITEPRPAARRPPPQAESPSPHEISSP